MIQQLEITLITIDQSIQQRVGGTDAQTLAEYGQAYLDGAEFPPVVVFGDGDSYILADGFHRVEAAAGAGLATINTDVRPGNYRDALLYSCGANGHHGRRATASDRRKAITTLLMDEEWSQRSDNWIAGIVGCSHTTVANIRRELGSTCQNGKSSQRKGADGRAYNVAHIGGRRRESSVGTATMSGSDDPDEDVIGTDGASLGGPLEPADIAAQRRMGIIPAGVDVQIDEPGEDNDEDQPHEQPELSDEDWLAQFSERSKLSERCRAWFDADALGFRQVVPMRRTYAKKCRPITNGVKKECRGHIPPWTSRHLSYFRSNGPASWLACVSCQGTGRLELVGRCPDCKGHGYHAS